jgi:hypothetical protein
VYLIIACVPYWGLNISKTRSGHPFFLFVFGIGIKFNIRNIWFKNLCLIFVSSSQSPWTKELAWPSRPAFCLILFLLVLQSEDIFVEPERYWRPHDDGLINIYTNTPAKMPHYINLVWYLLALGLIPGSSWSSTNLLRCNRCSSTRLCERLSLKEHLDENAPFFESPNNSSIWE